MHFRDKKIRRSSMHKICVGHLLDVQQFAPGRLSVVIAVFAINYRMLKCSRRRTVKK